MAQAKEETAELKNWAEKRKGYESLGGSGVSVVTGVIGHGDSKATVG